METPSLVIIGGGILGCALAWQMAARGVHRGDRIWVVERQAIASQATSRAAALLSCARPAKQAHWVSLVKATLAAIDTFRQEDRDFPIHRCGALHLAAGEESRNALAALARVATDQGVASEWQDPAMWQEPLPWLATTAFRSALWFPDEAYTDPYLLTQAYAQAGRAMGVRFVTGAAASLDARDGAVEVCIGGTRCLPASVWLTAGAWTNALLRPLQRAVPQAIVRSQYWITAPIEGVNAATPMVLAPELRLYIRREHQGLLFGVRESAGQAHPSTGWPDDMAGFCFDDTDPDGQRSLVEVAESLEQAVPGLWAAALPHYVSGPSCYTPDGEVILGRLPGFANLAVIGGCNGAGIALSAGLAGEACALESGSLEAASRQRYDPMRFGAIAADSPQFMQRCLATRAGKRSA